MDWYHRPGFWPTRDGVIPYHWFIQEFRAIPAVQAAEQLEGARAVALGQGRIANEDHALAELRRRAHGG